MIVQKPHDGGGTFDACFTNVVAEAAIAQNQFVIWDVASTGDNLGIHVIPCTAASPHGVGVAVQDAAVGDRFLVQTYGVYKGALTDTTIAAATNSLETGAAGAVRIGTTVPVANAGVLDKVGVALAADVGTAGDIFIRCM